ncbi:EF-hand domain-containing protein [Flavobacterium ovatum]|uniref:EF-hand domain-containing protein n=1 Tax=Flavobacterium ovatum TaxID=1928857 RepID=UPI003450F431
MKNRILKIVCSLVLFLGTANAFAQPNENQERKAPPTAEQLIKEMDANKDGKLSKEELKGPIKNDFTKIDTNKDGFLSLEELKKAPKPERKKPTE